MRVYPYGWLRVDISRIKAMREIECGQDHEEEGHKTENEFYYAHRLLTLRFPPPSNMPRDDQRFATLAERRGTSRKLHALFLVSPSVRRCILIAFMA
jgi:hypothetical protein